MSEEVSAILLTGVDAPWKLDTVLMDPKSLQVDEVLVDLVASGLCHSDLSWANGTLVRARAAFSRPVR
jgi:D-arabinose 1-dehydrogenase-like Zn-dependent alcohol dehydrogenase